METCTEGSVLATAVTTSSASSARNPPEPTLASARCTLRYAELAYGMSTVSVKRFPAASFSSERTSDVACPAVLYAVDPIMGIVCSYARPARSRARAFVVRASRRIASVFSALTWLIRLRQRRLLQISRHSDHPAHKGAHARDRQRRLESRLQIEVLRIDAHGGEAGNHAIGGAGNARGQKALGP